VPNPLDLFSLTGKTALVTGAGGGIGAAIAIMFAHAGANVICAGRTAATLETTVGAIQSNGGRADMIAFDVASESQVEAAFSELAQRSGTLDILVSNAALMTKHDFINMSADAWDAAQATNTRGAFLCTREAVKLMRGRGGAIVNIASVAAVHASVHGNAQYGASKAGLLALTRSVAVEFAAEGIRCNALLPGVVATDGGKAAGGNFPIRGPFAQKERILLGRIGKPDDIAAAALYLASNAASYVTGQSLIVDGGLTAG
jgi:NAD(P)-dependent dehydrogenase (short-subunit alcohol dehydrogenase family)